MPYNFVKSERSTLKQLGLEERWLQEQIALDPSILGLGDLILVRREKKQVTRGKLDLLLVDPVEGTRYTVEVMLGTLDESHIIRTIEYWDVERSRNPDSEHRAVIVAEDITNRFFNVIALLNRAVPLVAVQMSAVKFADQFVLTFTKVLDVVDLNTPEDESADEQRDRAFWDTKASKGSIGTVDALLALMPNDRPQPRVTYNQGHIAIGTVGTNFVWAYPRKKESHCFFDLRLEGEERASWVAKLSEAGVFAGPRGSLMKMRINQAELKDHAAVVCELLAACERASNRAT
ncbi:MAG TPA: hypothetical protein VLI72_06535 [Methylibium sp.]|nr:hypothetical protein [Methylibium sp.]